MEGTVNSDYLQKIFPKWKARWIQFICKKKKISGMEGKVNSIYRQKKNISRMEGTVNSIYLEINISRIEGAVNSIYLQKIFPEWKPRWIQFMCKTYFLNGRQGEFNLSAKKKKIFPEWKARWIQSTGKKKNISRMEGRVNSIYLQINISRMEGAVNSIYLQKIFPE